MITYDKLTITNFMVPEMSTIPSGVKWTTPFNSASDANVRPEGQRLG